MNQYSHHKKLSLVAELSDLAVVMTDKLGNIDWVNEAFERKSGYKLEEIIGKKPGSFLQGPATNIETIKLISKRLKELVSFNVEILNYTKAHETVWLDIFMSPIFEEEEHVGYLSIQTDISKRKKYEAALIMAKQAAEEAAKAKVHFVSVVTHELRTPLNAILGFTNILSYENPRQDQLNNLNMLKFSADNLMTLINDILDFGKVSEGKVDIDCIAFELGELVGNLYKNFLPAANAKQIELLLQVEDNLPNILHGDPARLLQILTNLLSNAIKFTKDGKVALEIKCKLIDEANAAIFFAVSDTGIGVPKEKQAEIFEPFSQADASISKKFGGTGLGLSMAKQLVKSMGGALEIDSDYSKGACFYFTLSLPIGNDTIIKPIEDIYLSEKILEKIKGKKILIAEDNKMNAIVVKKMLQRWPIEIQIAKNGIEAIELHAKTVFDIILMDLQMPEMDGFQSSSIIRAVNKEIPIIAFTASLFEETKKAALECGINDFILKPFEPAFLFEKLYKYMFLESVKVES
jgi:PAS domain S-box-containing protein